MSLNGDITLGNAATAGTATIEGDVIALGGSVTLNNDAVVTGNVIAAGTVTLKNGAVVMGNIITGGDFILDNAATVNGYIWAAGKIDLKAKITVGGDLISGSTIDIKSAGTIEGDVWAVGTVTNVGTISGTVYENSTSIPSYPPVDLQSTGTSAIVTSIDIYRITTTDGKTTTTCDVYIIDDPVLGTYGVPETCSSD